MEYPVNENKTVNAETIEASSLINVSEILDNAKVNKLSLIVLILCFFFMVIDGYDYGIISNAAPLIMQEWNIDAALFGPVFSVALFGWLLGSVIFGFLSDKTGRKWTLFIGGLIVVIGALGVYLSYNVAHLLIARFFTGVGAGGAVPVAMVLTSEYSPAKSRAKFITIMFSGFVVGTVLGSYIAAGVMPAAGWRAIFLIGAILPIPAILLIFFALPESARWLVANMKTQGQRATLIRVLKTARPELVVDENTRFAATFQGKKKQDQHSIKQIFKEKLAWATPMLWAFYVVSSLALFFIGNWMPQVLVMKGFTPGEASAMVGTSGIFGIAGTILVGLWLDKFGMRYGAIWPLITVVCTALIGGSTGAVLFVWICMNSFFMNGGHTILTVISPVIYPYDIRARGTGLANAAGKAGSIIGPIVGGVMISIGLPMTTLFYFAATPFILAAIFAWFLGRAYDFHFKPFYEGRIAGNSNPG